jgi:hypothetical protein
MQSMQHRRCTRYEWTGRHIRDNRQPTTCDELATFMEMLRVLSNQRDDQLDLTKISKFVVRPDLHFGSLTLYCNFSAILWASQSR